MPINAGIQAGKYGVERHRIAINSVRVDATRVIEVLVVVQRRVNPDPKALDLVRRD